MLSWIIKRRLAAFERRYGYDTSYMRDLLAADVRAFLAFVRVTPATRYRRDVPRDPYWAAKLVATVGEDCGPCTQLVVALALEDGAGAKMLAAVLARRDDELSDDVRLAVSFARTALAHDIEADPLRDEVVKRWGQRGLVSLALAVTTARIYPTIKYALGHGKTCQRVVVAGEQVAVARGA